jgi:hypothetical protein
MYREFADEALLRFAVSFVGRFFAGRENWLLISA